MSSSSAPREHLAQVREICGPDADVIAFLESALEKARAGGIVSAALVYQTLNATGHDYVIGERGNPGALVAHLEAVKTRIVVRRMLGGDP